MRDTFGLILLGINHEQRQDSFRSGHRICTLEKLQSHRRMPQQHKARRCSQAGG